MAGQPKDSRFESDARFKLPKKKQLKVKLDDRFKKSDFDGFLGPKIDKYGRNVEELQLKKDNDFEKYYEGQSDDEDSDSSSSGSSSSETEKPEVTVDLARGEGVSESSSDSDSDLDSEVESESESELEVAEEVETGDPTHRLALVNMDWDHIHANDLLATFSSFIKENQRILSVLIYPSEFGKERMAREEIEGPAREVFKKKNETKSQSDSEDSDSDSDSDLEVDIDNKFDMEMNKEKVIKSLYKEDEGVEYDLTSLRKYQLQRLRYYYAILVCDSVETAKRIYDNCDGLEFEATANFFDLRYVPDDVEFDDSEIKDRTEKLPVNYRPKTDFQTTALQHSKVKLTWDETPADRLELAAKAFSQKDLDEMDFKAYLASDSEEEDVASKYDVLKKNLTFGKEEDVDMEISFTPGGEKKEEKEDVEESTIDKYKRKAKERRKARKEKMKELKDKEKTVKETSKESAKNGSELELMMMDNEEEKNHFDLKQIMKSEKNKKKKKGKKNVDDEYLQDKFDLDLKDERFKPLFESSEFAIDPTQAEFKKTSTMMKIMEERNKRLEGEDEEKDKKDKADPKKRSLDSEDLVEKIKKKHKSKDKNNKKNKEKSKNKRS